MVILWQCSQVIENGLTSCLARRGVVGIVSLESFVMIFFFCQAVSYVICAATEKGHYNSLVALQDAEYMMAVRALWLGAAPPLCRCRAQCPVLPGLVVDRGTVGVAFAGLHEAAAVALWLHDVVPRCNWIVASRRAWQEGSRRLCAVQSVALARVRGCSFAVFADLT